MLHKETLEASTLELISRFQTDPVFDGFVLVGGTALALMIGHRTSVDIDLFSQEPFDTDIMLEYLENFYGFSLQYRHQNTLKGFVGKVFVDLLTHSYPMIREPEIEEGMILMSREDIAAMKVSAISGNGTRPKDFIDLYFLLKQFSISEILGFYAEKYKQRNIFHALKSLTYFEDMDEKAWPKMLLEKTLTPNTLKKALIKKTGEYLGK